MSWYSKFACLVKRRKISLIRIRLIMISLRTICKNIVILRPPLRQTNRRDASKTAFTPRQCAFFPDKSRIEQIEIWALLGGMPYYLRIFDPQQDIYENIKQHILSVRGTTALPTATLLPLDVATKANCCARCFVNSRKVRKRHRIVVCTGISKLAWSRFRISRPSRNQCQTD